MKVKNLIERYIYDVTRRLPEKDRDDVDRELRSNIYDMLPNGAVDEEIEKVLLELGSPVLLAEQYRPASRYLISPAFYDDYMRTIKWLLPLIGGILLVVGLALGALEAMRSGPMSGSAIFADIVANGIAMGFEGIIQVLIWTTLGFVIAERTSTKKSGRSSDWSLADLAEILPEHKGVIGLVDTVVELIVIVVFSIIAIAACAGVLPLVIVSVNIATKIIAPFAPTFLQTCIPVFAVMMILGVAECIVKMIDRRWTPLVCGVVMFKSLVDLGGMLYLITQPNILNPEFVIFLQTIEWGGFDLMRILATDSITPVVPIMAAIFVVIALIECGSAAYKMRKYR